MINLATALFLRPAARRYPPLLRRFDFCSSPQPSVRSSSSKGLPPFLILLRAAASERWTLLRLFATRAGLVLVIFEELLGEVWEFVAVVEEELFSYLDITQRSKLYTVIMIHVRNLGRDARVL